MNDPPSILILSASGRAAAAWVRREGLVPFVIDLFADSDTKAIAETRLCSRVAYPQGFVKLAEFVPPMPWMYTGGLENYPEVIETISQNRQLLGNGPEVLKRVRDPFWLAEAVKGTGFQFPKTLAPVSLGVRGAGGEGAWLRKPYRSAGGFGIAF